MDPSLGWEEPEVRGKRSEERRDLDLLTSSLIPLTSDPPRRRLPKNEEQILALERRTDYPRRTVSRSTANQTNLVLSYPQPRNPSNHVSEKNESVNDSAFRHQHIYFIRLSCVEPSALIMIPMEITVIRTHCKRVIIKLSSIF